MQLIDRLLRAYGRNVSSHTTLPPASKPWGQTRRV